MTTESEKPLDQQQPDPAAPAQTEDEKIWAEIIAAETPEPAQSKASGEEVSHEMADTSQPVTESQADANKDSPQGDKPDATVKDADKPAATPKEDIWANASPELRAAHEAELSAARKAANDAKAQAGRMRKLHEELQKASADRAADKPGSKKVGDLLDESLTEFPEIRDPVKTALAPIEKQLERLGQRAASTEEAQQSEVDAHVRSQREVLEAAHPGWMTEYVTGARAKQFYDWVLDQPRKVRETVFVTNKDEIFDAQAAVEVFDAFKASIAPPAPNPQPGNGQTQELSAKRAAQLDGSVSPRSPGGAPRRSGIPENGDPAAIWAAIPDDNADDRLRGGSFSRRRA